MAEDRAKEVLGGHKKSDKKKKRVHKMHVRRAANKGYIAEHHFQPEEGEDGVMGAVPETEEHVIPNLEAMKSHFAEHMPEEEQEMQGQV